MADDLPRAATTADAVTHGSVLARAFDDDPVFEHFLPLGRRDRDRRMERFFTGLFRSHLREPEPSTFVVDGRSVALWSPPGHWRMTVAEMVRFAPLAISTFRGTVPRALQSFTVIEKKHPRDPHWYLAVLGTDPEHQGKGHGSAVMRPVLDRCDAEGVGAYLESSKESNVPYYERHGFEVTEQLTLPAGGPPVWLMWRDPQPV